MILQVDGIDFSYRSRPVLKGVKFEVKKGEILSILGNNGAGKSTLLKCLNKILKPQKGTVFIDRKDVLKLSRLEVAKKIGYVAQRYESYNLDGTNFTVFEAVLMGRKPYIKWDVSAHDLEIVNNILRVFNLEELALRKINELSGGELQKVIIARALAQEPEMLLLDEPTNNLDLKNQLEVLQIVKKCVYEQNIAAIMVIHDINLALRFSDKFLFLKDNSVFACGGIEIMTPENISCVYGVPVTVKKHQNLPLVVPL